MALGSDPRFDLSKAYWLIAGIAGIEELDDFRNGPVLRHGDMIDIVPDCRMRCDRPALLRCNLLQQI